MLFTLCGFISVDMADNGSGTPNEYDRSSFKNLLKQVKKALNEGFDILMFPEGQLNPKPENGLLPVFTGVQSLSRSSQRPLAFVALHGGHRFWRANDESLMAGIHVVDRSIQVQSYTGDRVLESDDEFIQTFDAIVGHFGATGRPPPDLEAWLDGTAYVGQRITT
jgi:1-acyl-sn-glycerol-3-phosphate acyltransferase